MRRQPRGHSSWAVLIFLLLFAILIVGISEFYLLPALSAAKDANAVERAKLALVSRVLLMLVLFILFAGLFLTLRVGRFFFPGPTPPRTTTKYVDAWSEAGKRAHAEPRDETEDE
jgi:type II secretory pathway pseudopilin PulG